MRRACWLTGSGFPPLPNDRPWLLFADLLELADYFTARADEEMGLERPQKPPPPQP